eukprot:11202214-Lingulodinium_polyedra.AAC.1
MSITARVAIVGWRPISPGICELGTTGAVYLSNEAAPSPRSNAIGNWGFQLHCCAPSPTP